MDDEKESSALVPRKAKEAISDVLQEWGQLALEAMRSDNVLGHIPAVKTVAGFAKAAIGIKDQIFTRKLEKFLTGLSDVAPDERREMVRRLEADPAYGRKIGEHIIELLDRIESHRKPSMLGAVFAAFAAREFDETMLRDPLADHLSIASAEALAASIPNGPMPTVPTDERNTSAAPPASFYRATQPPKPHEFTVYVAAAMQNW
jgi:hypothetical protein